MKYTLLFLLFFCLSSQAQKRSTDVLNQIKELEEITVQYDPSAKDLIRKAVASSDKNNPEKVLKSFSFKNYTKLIVSADPDSLSEKIESVWTKKRGVEHVKIDSSKYKLKKILLKQHLYQTEKVSEFQFSKDKKLKERVTGARMAGFKKPIYEYLGLKLIPFSLYEDKITLFETKYINPVSKSGLSEYQFHITDTVYIGNRKVVATQFQTKNQHKSKRLSGMVYIDMESYAIAQTVFRVNTVINITAKNYFVYNKEYNLWFPSTNNFKIVKGNNKEDIKILGETIKFTTDAKGEKDNYDQVYVFSESWNSEIEFNPDIKIHKAQIALDISEASISRNENYWTPFRKDTLDLRSISTYTVLDSLVATEKYEEKIQIGRKVISGYIPLGAFDLDLRQLVKYNNFEGLRFGLGGTTNEKFSKFYKMFGYVAYGLKDEGTKYAIGNSVRIGNFTNSWLSITYTDDLLEYGNINFDVDKKRFKIYDPRPLNITTFYAHKTWKLAVESKIIPKTQAIWSLSQSKINTLIDYAFYNNNRYYTDYQLTLSTLSISWNPYSEYMQTPNGRLEYLSSFPKFTFQITHTIPNGLANDFNFGKFDFKIDYEKKYIRGQKTSFLMQSGIAFGDTPLTHLYSLSPNSLDKESLISRVNFTSKDGFETMRFNEFYSSEYALFQLKHEIGKLKIYSKVNPNLVLVSRAAWGDMHKKGNHQNMEFKTLTKGYFESGLELNNIYKGFGLSGFYRYGDYAFSNFKDNVSIKLSFNFNLGF